MFFFFCFMTISQKKDIFAKRVQHQNRYKLYKKIKRKVYNIEKTDNHKQFCEKNLFFLQNFTDSIKNKIINNLWIFPFDSDFSNFTFKKNNARLSRPMICEFNEIKGRKIKIKAEIIILIAFVLT